MKYLNQSAIPTAEPFFIPGREIGCLLVHGFTGTPKEMRTLGEFLNQKEYTSLGIRLAGHATHPEDMLRTRWQDWLQSVEDGLHLLNTHCSKIFVIGLSMGGILSSICASRFPVDGLVMLSTPYELPQDWRLNLLGLLKFVMPKVKKSEDGDWHNPEFSRDHKSYPYYPTASIIELKHLAAEMRRSEPEITAPALILQSIHDATVPKEHAQYHFDNIGSSQKEIFFVKNSGHIVTRDTDHQIVFEKIFQFIQQIC